MLLLVTCAFTSALYLLGGLTENPIKQTIYRISPTIANICVNGRHHI